MKMWLVLGVLFAALFQAVPKQADKPQPDQDDSKHPTEQSPKPTTAGTENVRFSGPSSEQKQESANAKPEQRTWCEEILEPVRANWPLLLVAVWGILVARSTLQAIRWQAEETANATKAMRDALPLQKSAADAALSNAKAVINSERPWMIIELKPLPQAPKQGYVEFRAWNRGRTPAEITDYRGDFFFHGIDEDFPADPTFKPFEMLYRQYISPGNSLSVYGFDLNGSMAPDQWQWMVKERKHLYFKGRIVYRDLITYEEHETRFCYWLSPADGVGLIMGGDRNWNKYT